VKEIAKAHKFAESNKDYKANPSAYLGSVSDAAEILRVALTGSVQSPNLHEILEILGKNEVAIRLEKIALLLKE
jgi:glutamyl-tRNA synthetase